MVCDDSEDGQDLWNCEEVGGFESYIEMDKEENLKTDKTNDGKRTEMDMSETYRHNTENVDDSMEVEKNHSRVKKVQNVLWVSF